MILALILLRRGNMLFAFLGITFQLQFHNNLTGRTVIQQSTYITYIVQHYCQCCVTIKQNDVTLFFYRLHRIATIEENRNDVNIHRRAQPPIRCYFSESSASVSQSHASRSYRKKRWLLRGTARMDCWKKWELNLFLRSLSSEKTNLNS